MGHGGEECWMENGAGRCVERDDVECVVAGMMLDFRFLSSGHLPRRPGGTAQLPVGGRKALARETNARHSIALTEARPDIVLGYVYADGAP